MITRGDKVRILGEGGSTWTVMSVTPISLLSNPPVQTHQVGLQGPGACRAYRTVRIDQVEVAR